jgi:hypothetical protein
MAPYKRPPRGRIYRSNRLFERHFHGVFTPLRLNFHPLHGMLTLLYPFELRLIAPE